MTILPNLPYGGYNKVSVFASRFGGRHALRHFFYSATCVLSRFTCTDGSRKFNFLDERVDSETIRYTMLIDRFSKAGIVEKSLGLLGKMIKSGFQPNLVTYTAILSGFCREGKLDEALGVFKLVSDLGLELDEFVYAILVDGFSRIGEFDWVFRFLEEMEEKGINPSIVTYNSLINGLCKFGRTSEAGEVSKDLSGDVITYSTLLHGYIKEENITGIKDTKHRLEEAGVGMDTVLCNILIKALFMIGEFEDAYALYKEMEVMNLVPNSVTYCTMIDGTCKVDRIDKALEVFDDLKRTSFSSVPCYNSIINGLCRKSMTDLATEVFVELNKKGLPLDVGICRMLIKAIFQKESAGGVLTFIYRINHLEPHVYDFICNHTISFLCKCNFHLAASEVCLLARRKGATVTSKSYFLILKGLIGCGKKLLSMSFISAFMKEYGIHEPRVCKILLRYMCLNNISNACGLPGKLNTSDLRFTVGAFKALINNGSVLDVYKIVMHENNMPLMDVVDYSMIVNELCKGGYPREALEICTFAEKKGISLNIITYNSVINGLCHHGCIVEAFRLFDSLEMLRSNLVPSEVTYAILIDSLCKAGFLKDAEELLQRMAVHGYKPNTRVYNLLIDSYCMLGQIEEAFKFLKVMEINGLNPDEFTVSAVINGYCQKSDMEAGLEFFDEYKSRGIWPDFLGFLYLVRGLCGKGRMEEARSILRQMLLSESVMELISRVQKQVEMESVENVLVYLCEQGSLKEAVAVLNEVASMFFPIQKYIIPYNAVLEKQLDDYKGLKKDKYLDYYSLITSLCARGDVHKANLIAKEMLSCLSSRN